MYNTYISMHMCMNISVHINIGKYIYTVMHHMIMIQIMMDCIYDNGPNKTILPSDTGAILAYISIPLMFTQ